MRLGVRPSVFACILVTGLFGGAGCGKNAAESKDASPSYAPEAGRDLSLLRDEMSAASRSLREAQKAEERAAGTLATTCAGRADDADCKAVFGALRAIGDAADDPRAIHAMAKTLRELSLRDATVTDQTRTLAAKLDATADAVERVEAVAAKLK
jgi:hypothetical protein